MAATPVRRVRLTVRRLRSDYLAIVTVSAAFIVWNVIDSLPAAVRRRHWPVQRAADHRQPQHQHRAVLTHHAARRGHPSGPVCLLSMRMFRSPFGRLLRAIREDEKVTSAFGHGSWRPQLWVFIIGCFMAGIAGGTASSSTSPPGARARSFRWNRSPARCADHRWLRQLLGCRLRCIRCHRRTGRAVTVCTHVWQPGRCRCDQSDHHRARIDSRAPLPARGPVPGAVVEVVPNDRLRPHGGACFAGATSRRDRRLSRQQAM